MKRRGREADLVQLKADEATDKGCCGRDRGYDLARDLLGGMPVSRSDVVVHRTQVRCGSDEVNVVVRVVVLLELNGVQAIADE